MSLKETKEVIKLMCSVLQTVEKVYEDGSIGIGDLGHLMPIVKDAIPAFKDMSLIPQELKKASSEDIKELIDYTKKEFDLKNDDLEEFIEGIIEIALGFVGVFETFKTLRN